MLRFLVCAAAIFMAGCSSDNRHYRLEVTPLPAGSERQISGTLLVGGVPEVVSGSLPLTREWNAPSLSGELSSPGAGGMALRLVVKPDDSVERDIRHEASGPLGVRGRIVETNGEVTRGMQVQVIAIPPAVAPEAAPVPAAEPEPAAVPAAP